MEAVPSVCDAEQVACARDVQRVCGSRWLVMWSPWRRTFTAFGCCTSVPVVIDDCTTAGLIHEIGSAELRFSGRAS